MIGDHKVPTGMARIRALAGNVGCAIAWWTIVAIAVALVWAFLRPTLERDGYSVLVFFTIVWLLEGLVVLLQATHRRADLTDDEEP